MKKYDAIIIGGNPAGASVAAAVKQFYREKKILVIRREKESLIPCGIPYALGTLEKVEQDIKPIKPLQDRGIDFIFDWVTSFNPQEKAVETESAGTFQYEKLVLATGSEPFLPPLKGRELKGVYAIGKELALIKEIKDELKGKENIVVIGAGFIGVEVSDELKKHADHVTLIEAMDHVLPLAFDGDISLELEKTLESHGVDLLLGKMVQEIRGQEGRVSEILLKDGKTIKSDMVIMAIGYRPNTDLAREAGLTLGQTGGIWTDEYLRTSEEDVFAVGDCVEHKDFFTRKPSRLMLASTAASEARIAGMNLFNIHVIRHCKGSIAIFSSSLGDISMGAAGITMAQAKKEGFDVILGKSKGRDRHPGVIEDASDVTVNLVISRESAVLLGAQILGGKSTGEMINILGLAIQNRMSVMDLSIMQYGTQPLLTAGPGVYPIVAAAMDGLSKIRD